MRANRGSRRGAVVALVAGTALLAPAAALGGYEAAQQVRDAQAAAPEPPTLPTPAASVEATASARPGALSDEARTRAEAATVRLSPQSGSWSGSGSVVSADGLVLTNAHVAQPTAPGLALHYGPTTLDESEPDRLVVSMSDGDGPAVPTYLAEVLVVDGYLDLAVLRIVSTVDGEPLPAGFALPHVPIGSAADVRLGDDLTVYGYPVLNGGDLLTVRTGVVGSFVPDRRGRVPGERHMIETSADFSAGNSGGMALDNSGRLVGVPSARLTTEELAVGHFLASVDLAAPLLAAARDGVAYASPYTTRPSGSEVVTDLGWADEYSCSAAPLAELSVDDAAAVGRIRLDGVAPGQDVLLVVRRDAAVVRLLASAFDEQADGGCLLAPLPRDGDGDLVSGEHSLEVRVGPERRLVGRSEVTVDEEYVG